MDPKIASFWINWNGFSNLGVLCVHFTVYLIVKRKGKWLRIISFLKTLLRFASMQVNRKTKNVVELLTLYILGCLRFSFQRRNNTSSEEL